MHHKINPGDVWIVSLKDTIGHEMLGERPAIVVAIHVETELVTRIPQKAPRLYLGDECGLRGRAGAGWWERKI